MTARYQYDNFTDEKKPRKLLLQNHIYRSLKNYGLSGSVLSITGEDVLKHLYATELFNNQSNMIIPEINRKSYGIIRDKLKLLGTRKIKVVYDDWVKVVRRLGTLCTDKVCLIDLDLCKTIKILWKSDGLRFGLHTILGKKRDSLADIFAITITHSLRNNNKEERNFYINKIAQLIMSWNYGIVKFDRYPYRDGMPMETVVFIATKQTLNEHREFKIDYNDKPRKINKKPSRITYKTTAIRGMIRQNKTVSEILSYVKANYLKPTSNEYIWKIKCYMRKEYRQENRLPDDLEENKYPTYLQDLRYSNR